MSPASTPRPPEYTGSDSWMAYSAQKNATGRSALTPCAVTGAAGSALTASSSAGAPPPPGGGAGAGGRGGGGEPVERGGMGLLEQPHRVGHAQRPAGRVD